MLDPIPGKTGRDVRDADKRESHEDLPEKPGGELILYQTEDGRTRLEVRLEDGTV